MAAVTKMGAIFLGLTSFIISFADIELLEKKKVISAPARSDMALSILVCVSAHNLKILLSKDRSLTDPVLLPNHTILTLEWDF